MPIEYAAFKWGDYSIVWVNSDDIPGALEFHHKHALDGIGISPFKGFALGDLSFLLHVKNLQTLIVVDAENMDIAPIADCCDLRVLVVADSKQPLLLENHTRLIDLTLVWNQKTVFPSPKECKSLRRLYLQNIKAESLSCLPSYVHLNTLKINQSPIKTLAGIERLNDISQLELHYCPRLEHISSIAALKKLSYLELDHCKNINDLDSLTKSPSINTLLLGDCGSVSNIEFIRKMKSLEDFRFVGTNVENGDLTPCLGLKHVGFLPKRHYSHKPEELRVLLKSTHE